MFTVATIFSNMQTPLGTQNLLTEETGPRIDPIPLPQLQQRF